MILVDSSVWIDLLADRSTMQTLAFEQLAVQEQPIALGDLVMIEVLQGIRQAGDYRRTFAQLASFDRIVIGDHHVAEVAARNFRYLRTLGVTIRKTIDTLIATRGILDNISLLYSDRDFDPFVQHLGLRSALDIPGVMP